ncbi:hypothetical protein K437DRAFT_256954 [Tilletiaria anomala UBC 951]|uniref:RRM domain-containing protein n=1 Tax=Tilletiaria anomala (strain ATCC 24038 / CBS 436.72 / UBC 951) TaxID=1037660 RepID=A0A066VSJ9_TILAU|nr:uncharacterized protein K437DRAFT_256954 [Tilletiaria anomala UBC 951]KDN44712.1 hypothetical protein K437DRAFT_256954 [Tilletiaria anomala UBC 951]
MSSITPNSSLYVKNINNKVKKAELRSQLYALFNAYGRIIDVVATRSKGMSGQAFIVFADLASATAALRSLNGFEFYDKQLRIDYAQTKSRATIIHELGHEALFDAKILATTKKSGSEGSGSASAAGGRVTFSSAQGKGKAGAKKRGRDEDDSGEEEDEDDEGDDVDESRSRRKAQKTEDDGKEDEGSDDGEAMQMVDEDEDADDAGVALGPPLPEAGGVPNDTLYCPDLPDDVTDEMLGVLFGQYPGLSSVSIEEPAASAVPTGGRRTKKAVAAVKYAFVKYERMQQATKAKDALHQFKLAPKKVLSVHYAKRG